MCFEVLQLVHLLSNFIVSESDLNARARARTLAGDWAKELIIMGWRHIDVPIDNNDIRASDIEEVSPKWPVAAEMTAFALLALPKSHRILMDEEEEEHESESGAYILQFHGGDSKGRDVSVDVLTCREGIL